MKTGTAVILGLGAAGVAYMLLKPKSAEASSTADENGSEPVEPPPTDNPSGQPAIAKRKGILKIVLKIRVSGFEKAMSNPNTILSDVMKGATALATALPNSCPTAPKLLGRPTGTIGGTSDGYAIQIAIPALWGSEKMGPIRKEPLDCIIREIRKNDKIKPRFISLTAQRINAYV